MNHIHWHILGAGAIGCLWGFHLHRSERPVSLLLRPLAARRYTGVIVDGERRTLATEVIGEASGTIKHLLICCKAQQSLAAVSSIAERLDDRATLVLLQNGQGVQEQLKQALANKPSIQILQASTTEAAYRQAPFTIQHTGRGITHLGGPANADKLGTLAQSLSPEPLRVDTHSNIEKLLWRKLAVNCAINPLTAIYRCYNGDLPSRCGAEVDVVIAEIEQLSSSLGKADYCSNLREHIYAVIESTAANRSSMLQDVIAGRPTEIDYINGHVCRLAEQQGLACPENQRLYHSVLKLTS